MRHKFLSFIESLNEETSISKPCEADEKYINECHKGLVEAVVNDKQRTVTIKKKGKNDERHITSEGMYGNHH